MLSGLTDRLTHRRSALQAVVERVGVDAGTLGPLGERQPFAVVLNDSVSARVATLFAACRPSAVLRFVRSIVVDTINRMRRGRTRAHVTEEGGEIVPLGADRDAPAAVACVVGRVRVGAAVPHQCPDAVLGRLALVVESSPNSGQFLFAEAAAACAVAVSQGSGAWGRGSAALAVTEPAGGAVSGVLGAGDHSEPSERLTDKVWTHIRSLPLQVAYACTAR